MADDNYKRLDEGYVPPREPQRRDNIAPDRRGYVPVSGPKRPTPPPPAKPSGGKK